MLEINDYRSLMGRFRAGDNDAATELVRVFEPEIRRAVRLRLSDPKLASLLDSSDICQSVLANFFIRAADGEFDLDDPKRVLGLLTKMARNRLRDHARHHRASKRDRRRNEPTDSSVLKNVVDSSATPSRIVAAREHLDRLRAELSEDECYLADQRALGRSWAELAVELSSTPEALRMRLTRALGRAERRLGAS